MQDEPMPIQEHTENTISEGTQRLIDHLGELWHRPHEPSTEAIKRIIQFVLSLPEQYRTAGLNAIAAQLVGGMSLHYLELLATFQEKAEQEDIDQEEREGTFEDVLPDWFHKMMDLSKHVSVGSVSELVNLSNITIGSYGRSQADSAENAQWWMYSLPREYLDSLLEEHLVTINSDTGQVAENVPEKRNLGEQDQDFDRSPHHTFIPWRSPSSKSIRPSVETWEKSPKSAA